MNEETTTKGRRVFREVPWMNKLEFEAVYAKLFSMDPIEQSWAVDRILYWKTRCRAALPLGVEATNALVSTAIPDYAVRNNIPLYKPFAVSLMYCTAISRFLNTISDMCQPHEKKFPMRDIAIECGIPEWIVDLRHKATHGSSSPNLEELRLGAETCLEWTKENYWEVELASCADYCPPCNEAEVACQKALLNFQISQYESLFGTENSGRKRKRGDKLSTKQIVSGITSLAKKNGECLINILATPEFLLSKTACSKPLLENSDPFIKKQAVTLPRYIELFWLPVICAVHEKGLLGNLVLTLLKSHNKLSDENQRMAIAWIWNILEASSESWGLNEDKDSLLSKALKNDVLYLDWVDLLDVCLHSLSKYIPAVLPIIVEHVFPLISESKKTCLMGLVAIATGALADADVHLNDVSTKGQKVYTVENIKTVLELQDVVDRGESSLHFTEDTEDHFNLCTDDINREELPLGYVYSVESGVPEPNDMEIDVLLQIKNEEKNGPTDEPGAVSMECDVSKNLNGSTEVPVDCEKTEDTLEVEEDESLVATDYNADFCEENIIVI